MKFFYPLSFFLTCGFCQQHITPLSLHLDCILHCKTGTKECVFYAWVHLWGGKAAPEPQRISESTNNICNKEVQSKVQLSFKYLQARWEVGHADIINKHRNKSTEIWCFSRSFVALFFFSTCWTRSSHLGPEGCLSFLELPMWSKKPQYWSVVYIISCFAWLVCIALFLVAFFFLFSVNSGILSCPVCKQTCFARDVVENFLLKDFPVGDSAMAKVSESHKVVACWNTVRWALKTEKISFWTTKILWYLA